MRRVRRTAGILAGFAVAVAGTVPSEAGSSRPSFARPSNPAITGARLGPRPSVSALGPSERLRPSSVGGVLGPVEEQEFLAAGGDGTIAPSDTVGAAGPSKVVTAVNIDYAVWDKAATGTPAPLAAGSLVSLAPSLGGAFVFDPKVVYDHYRARFVLVFLAAEGPPFTGGQKRSWIVVASMPEATATDPGTYCVRKLKGDAVGRNGSQFADYPGVGFDRKNLYVTTNNFAFKAQEEFEYVQILALSKTSLYACGKKVKRTVFAEGDTADPGKGVTFTIQPAVSETETGTGKVEYLVNLAEGTCGAFCGKRLSVWRVSPRRHRGLTLAVEKVTVGARQLGPLGTQRDGSAICNPLSTCWDPGDLRLINAFYDADRGMLYAAHVARADIAPGDGYVESAIYWYEIDVTPFKRAKAVRNGVIGFSQLDVGWPVVATDASGNLFVTFNRAGAPPPGEYLSAAVATVPPGALDPDSVVVLQPGEAMYVDNPTSFQRWGDYNGISRDPIDPAKIWTVNQYAESDGTPPVTPLWQQVVNRVAFA